MVDRNERQRKELDKEMVEELMYAFKRFHRRQMEVSSDPLLERKRSENRMLLLLHKLDREKKGMKVSELSERMRVTSPFVTQLLNDLEESRLIERRPDQKDRRMVRVSLTDQGSEAALDVQKWFYERFLALSKHLGEKDSRQLSKLLHKAFDFMENRDRSRDEEGGRQ